MSQGARLTAVIVVVAVAADLDDDAAGAAAGLAQGKGVRHGTRSAPPPTGALFIDTDYQVRRALVQCDRSTVAVAVQWRITGPPLLEKPR